MPPLSEMLKRLGTTERSKLMARTIPEETARLHIGDPFFDTPAHICHAALEAMQEGYTNYAPFPGDAELREETCRFLRQECGADFQTDGLLITNGATEAIFCSLAGYIDPGDEVLVFDPTYSLYATCVRAVGGVSVSVPLSAQFRVMKEELRQRVSTRSKMVIINNPNNPTGMLYSRDELKAVAEVAVENDLLVLSDEVYHKFVYDGAEHVSAAALPELRERCLVVNSFSKTYAMTGWRVGYVAGAEAIVKPLLPLHCALTGTVNHPAQRAALTALRGPQDCVDDMRSEYVSRREKMLSAIQRIEGLSCIPPDGAFYVFCKFDLPLTSAELTEELINRGVAVRSGTEYGPCGEGHIRLAFTPPALEIEEGMERLGKAFRELK